MINLKLGGDNTWAIINSNQPADCDIRIDYKYIDERYANAEITVTIKSLDARRNRQVDRGELYIGLAQYNRQRRDVRNYHCNYDKYEEYNWFCCGITDKNYGLIPTPCFHKVVRGKTQYKFNIGPCYTLREMLKPNTAYYHAAENSILNRNPVHIKLCGCLYRIRIPDFTNYVNTNEFGKWLTTTSSTFNAVDNHWKHWRVYDEDFSTYTKMTNGGFIWRYRFLHTMFINPIAKTPQITIIGTNIQC